MLVPIEDTQRALRTAEIAKDLSPSVRTMLAQVIAVTLSNLCDVDEEPTHHRLLDIRGELRGAVAFSRELDSAIKSGSIHEEEKKQ